MSKWQDTFYRNQNKVYKALLLLSCMAFIVYLLPKSGKFGYEFDPAEPWQYDNLMAEFDFSVQKSDEQLEADRAAVAEAVIPYYKRDTTVVVRAKQQLREELQASLSDTLSPRKLKSVLADGERVLNSVYDDGLLVSETEGQDRDVIFLRTGNRVAQRPFSRFVTPDEIRERVIQELGPGYSAGMRSVLLGSIYSNLQPNIEYDAEFTQRELDNQLSGLSLTSGVIKQGTRIISKGQMISQQDYLTLLSYQSRFESVEWTTSNYTWNLVGYIILVTIALIMLMLFIQTYRPLVYENNVKVTFIYFNIVLMVALTVFVVGLDVAWVYVVPVCILPLVIKSFFDARLGLFAHVITLIILGFVVSNSYEYMFLQTMAGIVTILTVPELYKRANLFISIGQITAVYMVSYLAFFLIHNGGPEGLDWQVFLVFGLNGLATLFVQPIIYVYERLFGLVSDVSLLELSDYNSKLLKELSNKAPGTFHHSLNVANLAEAAADAIGANTMLIRVGALYHDVGKMANPTYYTENQSSGFNPHDDLSPEESARMIIDHVLIGIEIARRNGLPDRIIDFIRTHHGTSLVYYFYKQAKEENENVDQSKFRYPGPIPFSRETAILMMADSVEAASKSLKTPTSLLIDGLVDKIIAKQMDEGQYNNANITFREIEQIKEVLKTKLANIYHLRIEYPE